MPIYWSDTSGGYITTAATTTSSTTTSTSYITWTESATTAATTTSTGYHPLGRTYVATQWRAYHSYEAEQTRQEAIISRHWIKARKRANELLLSQLTPEQRKTFKDNKWFVVEGGESKQRYRIRAVDHLVANIDVLDGESVKHRLCAHADLATIPLGDQLLAQKMMIEAAEDEFLRVANRHAA